MFGPFPYFWTYPPPFPGCNVTVSWGTKSKSGVAVIDTGADRTFVPIRFVRELRLRKIDDSIDVEGPEAPDEAQDEYVANLTFLVLSYANWPVISNNRWDEILIGRDIINKWRLTLDGPTQQFTIE